MCKASPGKPCSNSKTLPNIISKKSPAYLAQNSHLLQGLKEKEGLGEKNRAEDEHMSFTSATHRAARPSVISVTDT